jgi:hypothetical protein
MPPLWNGRTFLRKAANGYTPLAVPAYRRVRSDDRRSGECSALPPVFRWACLGLVMKLMEQYNTLRSQPGSPFALRILFGFSLTLVGEPPKQPLLAALGLLSSTIPTSVKERGHPEGRSIGPYGVWDTSIMRLFFYCVTGIVEDFLDFLQ